MNKKAIIITVISTLALLLLFYLVLSTELVTVKPETAGNISAKKMEINKAPVDPQKLEDSYKAYVKATISEYENLLAPYFETTTAAEAEAADAAASTTGTMDADNLEEQLSGLSRIKISLMDVTVPEGFQELHIDLVKLFTSARVFLESQEESDKDDNLALLDKIKTDYPWVNE